MGSRFIAVFLTLHRRSAISGGGLLSMSEYEVDRPGVRVSYDDGRLEIMSPLPEHEEYKDCIYRMVCVFAEAYDIEVETRGSATWKRHSLRKGSEPDTCFYIANAPKIIGRRKID